MSDAAFATARYPGMTTVELKNAIANGNDGHGLIAAEVARREAVKAGDVTQMTPGERLRYYRAAASKKDA